MFRNWLKTATKTKPSMAIYTGIHGKSSLYEKLQQHCRGQFDIQTKQGDLCPMDFKFLKECVDVHPENKAIIHRLFGKNQFDSLSDEDFNRVNLGLPLVIDYANKLVASDCESFDRILANYNGCGMQHFRFAEHAEHDLVHPNCADYADLF